MEIGPSNSIPRRAKDHGEVSVVSSVAISPTKFPLTKLNFIRVKTRKFLHTKVLGFFNHKMQVKTSKFSLTKINYRNAKEKENDSDVFTLLFTKAMCSLLRVFIYIFLQLIANWQLARVEYHKQK